MKQRALGLLLVSTVIGGALLASACSGRSISHRDGGADDDGERGGSAGTIERGGTSGTSGTGGTGGTTPPTGGVAGTTFPGGASGTSGSGSYPPPCASAEGPRVSSDARRTIPFSLTPAGAGGAASEASDLELSGAGGAGGELDGCAPIPDGYECLGEARATTSGGALLFTFSDGSTLEWTGNTGAFVAPPQIAPGSYVFIEYRHETPWLCPFCGTYTQTTLTMWGDGGLVIWQGQEGSRLPEVEQQLALSLFGVSYRRSPACLVPTFNVDCYVVDRELWDIWLETEPEQWIPRATPTVVSTPNGEFEVMWTSSEQTETRQDLCEDGGLPARDRGFAVSRLAWL